jgi:hypothetical protein
VLYRPIRISPNLRGRPTGGDAHTAFSQETITTNSYYYSYVLVLELIVAHYVDTNGSQNLGELSKVDLQAKKVMDVGIMHLEAK